MSSWQLHGAEVPLSSFSVLLLDASIFALVAYLSLIFKKKLATVVSLSL
jgi:hypothetical protein